MRRTLIVVDHEELLANPGELNVIGFDRYLADYPQKNEPLTRIINLCDTAHYLSRGYYCSLLAEARQHRVLPSVSCINDLRDLTQAELSGLSLGHAEALRKTLKVGESLELQIYFGWTVDEQWQKLSRQLFDSYPAPLLHLRVQRESSGLQLQLRRMALAELDTDAQAAVLERLQLYTAQTWKGPAAKKRQRWDMAILVDPEEKFPPSDKDAVKLFIKAAAKVGINAQTITAQDMPHVGQFDALFIRETTAIDHHTYRLARRAEREGLVVMDDPTSILRCCNKVFLHDAFTYNGVPSLKTRVIGDSSEESLDRIEAEFSYPLVLKMPESSFSKGVFKVDNRDGLRQRAHSLLQDTALLLVQEYLYTDFDWRIGVLNGRPIYACRYHMARNHWQIYNHGDNRTTSGGFETLPTFEVPRRVLDAALKAAAMIGNGLYGVDLKQKDSQVYVIEVNDNPSIDHRVEDRYLGNELYMQIMHEFARRLEQRGR
ncbi:RimK family protein [Neptuniibacter sp. CAU 1671]|uniref:RimK family protein n=1 Tax=Neptuniibacter sp. CAU 1671 TaxID=3032593 RepID=UPI0023DA143A|nr:RimK family protein [Neptuniibacter sp. CAU 1671]MDF2182110.1 RimK family protein [Neptuniibacter sp. CAU 1671]